MDQKVEEMGKQQFDMSNYVDVAERIRRFKEAFPQGSLRPLNPEEPYRIEVIGERTFIVYIAAAYRHPEDTNPGVGVAWETFPGQTPYTRDSELMNAETSAWGRAIKASLAASDEPKIASANEVRNRQGSSDAPSTGGKLAFVKRTADSIAAKHDTTAAALFQDLFQTMPDGLDDDGLSNMMDSLMLIKRGQIKIVKDSESHLWVIDESEASNDD
jgi:hypothetical protein